MKYKHTDKQCVKYKHTDKQCVKYMHIDKQCVKYYGQAMCEYKLTDSTV